MTDKKTIKHIQETFTKQYSQFYCGLACLASIIKYYGGEITQEKLQEESGTTLQGTSLLGLYQSAQKLGFEAKGYEADIENLKTIKEPVILHVLKEGNLQHYIICYGYENSKFLIGDPSWGITEYQDDELDAMWVSKTLLWLKPNKEFRKKEVESKDKKRWFWELINQDIPILSVAAFMGVVISVLGLAVAIYTQKLIDQILPSKDNELLLKSLVIFILILLARAFIGYIRGIFLIRQSKDMNVRVVSSFFSKLLNLPQRFFDSTSTGDMIGRLNDSQRIQRVVINLSSNIVIDVLIVITSIVYIIILSTSIGLFSLLAVPIFGLIAFKYNKKIIDHQREVMQAYAMAESKYIDTIKGIQVIKWRNKESQLSKFVQTVYEFFQEKVYDLGITSNKMNLLVQIGSVVILSGVIAWSSVLVLNEQLLLGEMMAIVTIAGSFVSSVINIAMANIQLQEAKVAFDRMYEFSAIEPEYEQINLTGAPQSIDSVNIERLNFRFPGKSLLLKETSLHLKRGEFATIFGEVGCGKSTLLSILQRFYPYESGEILINDKNWNEIDTISWREKVAVVSQKTSLFNGTIIQNIAMDDNVDAQSVVNFCKETGLDHFINKFQQGYLTIINEDSTNLSGGQQQIIALARALYQKPQLLLLDEATAAMDSFTERFIVDLLQKLRSEMIIVFVTHTVNIAEQADKVYSLKNKQIAPVLINELIASD